MGTNRGEAHEMHEMHPPIDHSGTENGNATSKESARTDDPEKTILPSADDAPNCYLTGWRLHCTTLGIVLSLLLVNVEVTIVGTSLVDITNDLSGFGETSWIVSGYLVTYMGSVSPPAVVPMRDNMLMEYLQVSTSYGVSSATSSVARACSSSAWPYSPSGPQVAQLRKQCIN